MGQSAFALGRLGQQTRLMRYLSFAVLTAPLLLLLPLAAQGRIYVVDAQRGAGSQFADLPAAILAARAGDRIVVRKGDYSQFVLNKGVSIVGELGVSISKGGSESQIANVPAGRTASLTNVYLTARFGVSKCQGHVVLDRVRSKTFALLSEAPFVLVRNCEFSQFHAVRSGVQVTGGRFLNDGGAYEAVYLGDSIMTLAGCSVTGGGSLFWNWSAIDMDTGSVLTITGDSSTVIATGRGAYFPPAIMGLGTLVLDPRVTVKHKIDPKLTVIRRTVPLVKCWAARLGGATQVSLAAVTGQVFFLVGGPHARPVFVPSLWGNLWLDLPRSVVVASGTLPAGGVVTVKLPVPRNPVLLGVSYVWQGVAGAPGRLALSNPCAFVNAL